MNRRRLLGLFAAGYVGTVLQAACTTEPSPAAQRTSGPVSATATASAATRSKPIVMGVAGEAAGLSRFLYLVDTPSELIDRYPVKYDVKNGTTKLLPAMAQSMPEILDDGLRYRVKYRDDVYYHDGTKLDADAVAYLAQAQIDKGHPQYGLPGSGSWKQAAHMQMIKEVKAVDKLTVDFYMKSINAPQLGWFAEAWASGVPIKALQGGFDFAGKELGAGPYRVAEWQRNVRMVLERWEKHYDPQEGVAPQIIVRPIPELGSRVAALEAGEIDWAEGVPVDEAARLRAVKGVKVAEAKTLWVWFIHMDTRKKPFDDVRVRQALNYAVDKDTLIKNVLSGAGQRSYAPLSPQFGAYYAGDSVTHYDYNPQKAKDLLREAGYPNGFESKIYFPTDRVGQQKPAEMCQFIQANLAAVGVKVGLEQIEYTTFESRRIKGEFEMAARGWTPATPDPDGVILQNFHGSFAPPKGRNVTYLNDTQVNGLLDAGSGTTDETKRINSFMQAQKRIVDLAPWIFIDHAIAYEGTRDTLRDYVPHPLIPAGRGIVHSFKE